MNNKAGSVNKFFIPWPEKGTLFPGELMNFRMFPDILLTKP
jgi:hypothetical protein